MKMTGIKWVTLLVLVFGAVSVSAQSEGEEYPFGEREGDDCC